MDLKINLNDKEMREAVKELIVSQAKKILREEFTNLIQTCIVNKIDKKIGEDLIKRALNDYYFNSNSAKSREELLTNKIKTLIQTQINEILDKEGFKAKIDSFNIEQMIKTKIDRELDLRFSNVDIGVVVNSKLYGAKKNGK